MTKVVTTISAILVIALILTLYAGNCILEQEIENKDKIINKMAETLTYNNNNICSEIQNNKYNQELKRDNTIL